MPETGTCPELTQGEARILLLRDGLPAPLFQQAALMLLNGQSASFTTNLILLQPDHGQLHEWRYETLHPLVSALKARLQGWLTCPTVELAPEWLRSVLEEWNTGLHGGSRTSLTQILITPSVQQAAIDTKNPR